MHVDHEQVEPAIAVVVERFGANCPVWSGAQSSGGDIGKRAVAIVAIELASTEHAGHEQVDETVIVVVEHRDVAGPAASSQTRFVGDVGEGAVAVVVVEDVVLDRTIHQALETRLALVVPTRKIEVVGGPVGGVGEKEIEQAVVVVVEKGSAL